MRNSPLSDLLKQHKRIFSSFIVCFSLFSVRLFSRNRFFNLVLTKYSVFRLWASCKAASADGSQKKNFSRSIILFNKSLLSLVGGSATSKPASTEALTCINPHGGFQL